jgi:transposase-like protein
MSWSSGASALRWRATGPIAHIAHDLGMHPETLRKKVRQAEAESGRRSDPADHAGARGDPPAAQGEL